MHPPNIGMRTLDVPRTLGSPVAEAKHGVRPGPAAEVGAILPASEIVPAGEAGTCPVRNLVMNESGGREAISGSPVFIELGLSARHLYDSSPHFLSETSPGFDRQFIGREVHHALGDDAVERFHPGATLNARHPI